MVQIIPLAIDKIKAITHTADSFGGLPIVVWEYIANGIDYISKGTKPEIEVKIDEDSISFADQGRGLDVEDLKRFFTLYAPNKDREEGNYTFFGRGYFGTGGFSIFKYANYLEITSVKNGKLYQGEITSQDIAKDKGFKLVVNGTKTDLPNGTKIKATKLKKEINQKTIKNIKEYVLFQMMRTKGAEVWINNELIEYIEPPVEEELTKIIYSKDTAFYKDLCDLGFGAGNIKLTLKKTKKPLSKGEYGVAVLADGKLLEVCSPGIETKKHCDYIIGDAEVENLYPNLEKFKPPLFDQSRRRELLLDHKYAIKLRSFIGFHLEQFEKEVAEIEKNREQTKFDKEFNKKLAEITNKLNEVLKDELDELELNSKNQKNLSSKSRRDSAYKEVITKIVRPGEDFFKKKKKDPNPGPHIDRPFNKDIKKKNNSILAEEKTKKNNSGGLRIIQKPLGEDEFRAVWYEKEATIIINTDFPLIKRFVKKGDLEKEEFHYLLKEIALTELAIAMTTILIDNYGDTTSALVDLRKRINNLSLKFDSISV